MHACRQNRACSLIALEFSSGSSAMRTACFTVGLGMCICKSHENSIKKPMGSVCACLAGEGGGEVCHKHERQNTQRNNDCNENNTRIQRYTFTILPRHEFCMYEIRLVVTLCRWWSVKIQDMSQTVLKTDYGPWKCWTWKCAYRKCGLQITKVWIMKTCTAMCCENILNAYS